MYTLEMVTLLYWRVDLRHDPSIKLKICIKFLCLLIIKLGKMSLCDMCKEPFIQKHRGHSLEVIFTKLTMYVFGCHSGVGCSIVISGKNWLLGTLTPVNSDHIEVTL